MGGLLAGPLGMAAGAKSGAALLAAGALGGAAMKHVADSRSGHGAAGTGHGTAAEGREMRPLGSKRAEEIET